jgi:low temperature requirement protein LtrA
MMRLSGLFSDLFRVPGNTHHRVTSSELFFDLVYAFAITQLASFLLGRLALRGAFETGLLLLAVWWAWMFTSWATNWLDPDKRAVRIMLFAAMGLSLLMSALLPTAFGAHGVGFAVAYVALQVGRTCFIVVATREDPPLHRNFLRVLCWFIGSGVFWLLGGFAHDTGRVLLWVTAIAIDLAGPFAGFATPGLGKSRTTDWSISGGHLAERCQLFVLIVLGESIVDTGTAFASSAAGLWETIAMIVAFAGSVGFWWIYFDRSADLGGHLIETASDPGRIGRTVYVYWQVPMVAGILVSAVGDQLTIHQPRGDTSAATALVTLGGPALFIWGYYMFMRVAFERSMPVLLVALAALFICLPLATVLPPVAMGGLSTLAVLAIVAQMAIRQQAVASVAEAVASSNRAAR